MRERNQSLDAGKGLAIILVMFGHCIVLNGLQDGYLYDAIKAVQMPFFMLISGCLAGMSSGFADRRELLCKIKKRAVCYLLPFFFWIIVLHLGNPFVALKEILLELDKGLWFLMTLFLLTVVMYLAVYLRDNTGLGLKGFAGVWLLFTAVLLLQTAAGNTFLSPHLTIFHLPFYLGGYFLPIFKPGKLAKHKVLIAASGIVGILVFSYFMVRYDMIVANNKIELVLQMAAGFLGSFLCMGGIRLLKGKRAERVLAYIGRFTLEIYVIHYHFATLLGLEKKGITLLSPEGFLWLMAAFALMSLCTAVSIALLKHFRITNFLLFGKQGRD